jgi:hypothetical protein
MNDHVLFTTPGVDRIFIACGACHRTVPHYRVYGPTATGRCRCGHTMYRPVELPPWKAAWWLLVVGWLWRKTLRQQTAWDPRMPLRQS